MMSARKGQKYQSGKSLDALYGAQLVKARRVGMTVDEMMDATGLNRRQVAKILAAHRSDIYQLSDEERAVANSGEIKDKVRKTIDGILDQAPILIQRAAGPDGDYAGVSPRDALNAGINIARVAVDVKRVQEPPPAPTNINVTAEEAHIIGQEVKQLFMKGAVEVGDDVDPREGVELAIDPEVEFMLEQVPDEDMEDD